jgi:hypothetical protein
LDSIAFLHTAAAAFTAIALPLLPLLRCRCRRCAALPPPVPLPPSLPPSLPPPLLPLFAV